jgi:hypothetical protein
MYLALALGRYSALISASEKLILVTPEKIPRFDEVSETFSLGSRSNTSPGINQSKHVERDFFLDLGLLYIKSCSHEVAKHKSGVICQFHLTVPPLATTLRKMVSNGERPRWLTPYQKTSNTNPMSKFVSPKTFQSNKSAKIFKILVKLGLII